MTKVCITCGAEKDETEFCWHDGSHTKRKGQCRVCRNETARRWRRKNPEKHREIARRNGQQQKSKDPKAYARRSRASRLKHAYGLTLEQFDAMVVAQDNRCAICGQLEIPGKDNVVEDLCVDHDHRTGKVRALLCHRCNTVLGFAQDNSRRLRKAAAYLEYHGE